MNLRLQTAWRGVFLYRLLLLLASAIIAFPMIGLVLPLLSIHWVTDTDTARIFYVSSRQLALLARSVLFSALVAAVTAVIGAVLAVILIRSKSGKRMLAIILPPLIVVPPAIHGIYWTATIMTAGQWLSRHGLIAAQPGGWLTAGLAEVLSFLPVAIAVAWAGFAMLDPRLLEAGIIYRPEPAVLAGIAVRLAMPVLLSGAGVIFLLSLSDYAVPSLFSVNVYALEIFSTYSTGIHPAAAVLTAAPLIAIIAATLTAVLRTGLRVQAMAMSRNPSSASMGSGMQINRAAAIVLLLYFISPLAVMTATAGSFGSLAIAASGARSEIGVTIAVALSAAALCVLLGLAVGRALDKKGPVSTILWILACLAFALPAPLIGIGILQLGGFGSWFEEFLPVWATTARFLPIAAFISFAMHRRAENGLIEAGRVFAHSRLHGLLRVTLPLMLPGLVISGATCFAFSMGELGATLLVAAPGHATLMMRLYNLLHYGASRDVAALCLLLALPALASGLLLTVILNQRAAKIVLEPGNV
ncbi:MAG: iron ABC transporter permease [Nitrospirae bacterium]|nr:MAG: iron ABC transporter permease [Nitrospirota bacterium]